MDNTKIKKQEKVVEEKADEGLEKENLDVVEVVSDLDHGETDPRDAKITELNELLKRAIADYRNLERRTYDERSEAIRYANKHLIEALLPAFDTLFLAGKYTTDESVKLTITRILEVLKDNGIEKVMTNDAKYNADTMEAIEVVEGTKDMVIEEVRPGFTINGKLIRPAQVKVGGK